MVAPGRSSLVAMPHRSGAPRLIEWTGERCVPWAPDVQVVYEHMHRYLWASQLVGGRRVLDLASGEGFGAAILAGEAASVLGIDLDQTTVDHSALNYGSDRIEFRQGDARDLSSLQDGSFGAVIAFEMIEHVDDQQRVLEEIARILEPDGLLVISTPDRRAYTEATGRHNPFHVRELDREQFTGLLGGRFEHVACWGQRTITGSALSALSGRERAADGGAAAETFFVERQGDGWQAAPGLSPLYLVAVASRAELPSIPRESTLADGALELLRAAEATGETAVAERQREVERLQDTFSRERSRWESEIGELSEQAGELRAALWDRQTEIELRARRVRDLLDDAGKDREHIAVLGAELTAMRQLTARVEQSISWKLFERGRGKLLGALGGPGSLRTRALRRGLRAAAGRAGGRPQTAGTEGETGAEPTIEFPEFDRPEVSIVIPLYSGAELTDGCLDSIRDRTTGVAYEVILVDDAADPATKALLSRVRGARTVVNETNLGYLRSVNLGASHARGRWIVLCNNDIAVYDGWLPSMLACARSSPDVGVVTPKYLYPDGSLNEAGGIVWRDGTGGNYGRGAVPSECRYEFRREVDYGSAAALMVRADFWREVGGFDERFMPMYYEDTDLCFEAREHGLRVLYEPRANVVHLEGGTAGTDLSAGPKRYQEVNRPKFVQKWGRRLASEQLPASPHNTRRAANRNRGPHVLIVDHRVPMWDRDSGSLRLLGMIKALQTLGCRITLLPDDRHLVQPYTVELMAMGVEVLYGDVDIAAELTEVGPGLAMIISCRPHATTHWLDLLRDRAPSVPIVYDTVDLHWLREARRAALAEGSDRIALGPKAVALREIELALIRATDATLVVTPEERAQVQADVPGAVVHVVPNVNEIREDPPGVDSRVGVLFIGSFEHTPNVDAAVRLVRAVMPRVWSELGDIPVTIVGGGAPPEVLELSSPLVGVAGWVQDVEPLLDSVRATVAPLSYGAGLKGKVTQALAAGLPVVTTSVGAEGLGAVSGEHLLVADDDRELAAHVVEVLRDDDLWAALSSSGQRLARESFSPAVVTERMSELLAGRGRLRPVGSGSRRG
jgi:GT2 family glycosyltransferase/SAM-dependent methyltransferase/glycosyltransferase involved in cell wall biosynthesis